MNRQDHHCHYHRSLYPRVWAEVVRISAEVEVRSLAGKGRVSVEEGLLPHCHHVVLFGELFLAFFLLQVTNKGLQSNLQPSWDRQATLQVKCTSLPLPVGAGLAAFFEFAFFPPALFSFPVPFAEAPLGGSDVGKCYIHTLYCMGYENNSCLAAYGLVN